MNPDLGYIFSRRSVRQYRDGEISDEMVTDLLEAAMAAPSAVAKDPWEFIVVRDRQMLKDISDGLPNGKLLAKAGVGIVVCGDVQRAHDQQESYMIQDCSAAIQNILLASQTLGLGSCWLGVHPRQPRIDHIRSLFKMPGRIIPLAVIAIGFPLNETVPRTRYNEDLVHIGKW